MKKTINDISCAVMAAFLFGTILTTVSSCADDYKFEKDLSKEKLIESPIRTIGEAINVAEQAKGMITDKTSIRSGQTRAVDKVNVRVICGSKTRSNSLNASDTLIYVVNYEDNEGFAIISANRGTEALLGVTEMGNYDDAIAENDGFSLFMDLAKKYVKNSSRFNGDQFLEIETTMIDSLNPLITVKWGQEFPEGFYCPNTKSGCANTAAIQICSYYEYPTKLNLTFSQRERDSITIDWTEIKKHQVGSWSYATHTNCLASEDSHKIIAELARQCGVYSNSQYWYYNIQLSNNSPLPYSYTYYECISGSSTSTLLESTLELDAIDMIESLGYVRPQKHLYTSQCTWFPLSLGRPVCMFGAESNLEGHYWVVDGFKYYRDIVTDHATEPATITTAYRYYNHVNWGWNGISNGYFLDGVFNCDEAYSYDDESLLPESNSYTVGLYYFTVRR